MPEGPGTPERDDALEWLRAQARDIEQRIAALVEAAERLCEERVATARAAAEAIVNAALKEAEEIRRAAAEGGPPSNSLGGPSRARVFVGADEVEEARRLAEELILGGLGRSRIEAELMARFPDIGPERVEAIMRALLVPPSPPRRADDVNGP